MKPLKVETKEMIQMLNQGGVRIFGNVYLFPDYENKVMGLYDERGFLVGTRPMSRGERQLHINSHSKLAVNE